MEIVRTATVLLGEVLGAFFTTASSRWARHLGVTRVTAAMMRRVCFPVIAELLLLLDVFEGKVVLLVLGGRTPPPPTLAPRNDAGGTSKLAARL